MPEWSQWFVFHIILHSSWPLSRSFENPWFVSSPSVWTDVDSGDLHCSVIYW
jgi:hypothetical protein